MKGVCAGAVGARTSWLRFSVIDYVAKKANNVLKSPVELSNWRLRAGRFRESWISCDVFVEWEW